MTETITYCRICHGHCGLVVTIDDDGRPVSARGDRDDPRSIGYICSKGSTLPAAHTEPSRLLRPLKRQADGSFAEIGLEQALDEIADRLRMILDEHGPDAVAGYRGTGGFFTTAGLGMLPGFLGAMGSHKLYTTLTIDQSAKLIAAFRLGVWPPGKQDFQTSDVAMVMGVNPMVSMAQLDTRNPVKRMKDAKARGLKLIVIDPRRTETAQFADLFVQPLPGHDAEITAAILRIVLENGWHDAEFCAAHVADLDRLRAQVAPFTAERVADVAGIQPSEIQAIAEMFARDGTRGIAATGTGTDMGPHSNLAEHLVETLNIVCGRMIRAGERIPNQGFVLNRGPKPAQVVPLPRAWENGPRSRVGDYGAIGGEMVTGMLADDILQPGPGRVRFMLNHGGNPASAVPDQRKMARALEALDLLVSIEPTMSATACYADYILPPKLQLERPDLPIYLFEPSIFPTPYTRYTPPVVAPPPGSEVCDEWRVMWELAARLGLQIDFMGVPLDMTSAPTEDALIALTLAAAPASLDEIRRHPRGYFHEEEVFALPADPATAGRFTTMPDDVVAEITLLREEFDAPARDGHAFRMINRRSRHRMNSMGANLPELQRLVAHNLGYMNPADMAAQGIANGDWIEIRSDHGAIRVLAEADPMLREGVVSISHGFGAFPGAADFRKQGASPNLLISTDRDLQTINAMPRMTAIPVSVTRVHGEGTA